MQTGRVADQAAPVACGGTSGALRSNDVHRSPIKTRAPRRWPGPGRASPPRVSVAAITAPSTIGELQITTCSRCPVSGNSSIAISLLVSAPPRSTRTATPAAEHALDRRANCRHVGAEAAVGSAAAEWATRHLRRPTISRTMSAAPSATLGRMRDDHHRHPSSATAHALRARARRTPRRSAARSTAPPDRDGRSSARRVGRAALWRLASVLGARRDRPGGGLGAPDR